MWQTFLLAAGVFAIAFIGLAIGVIISNRRLKGSCGGLGNMKDSQGLTICDGCTNPSPECVGEPLAVDKTSDCSTSGTGDCSITNDQNASV